MGKTANPPLNERRSLILDSPVGPLYLTADGDHLFELRFGARAGVIPPGETPVLLEAARQLDAYFAGALRAFDLPLMPEGTDFQRRCWNALLEIPYGETVSYGEIARRIGRPRATRAVGMANHNNPISIIIPCHRVIGKNGSLTGYGGGLENKKWLLSLEQGRAKL